MFLDHSDQLYTRFGFGSKAVPFRDETTPGIASCPVEAEVLGLHLGADVFCFRQSVLTVLVDAEARPWRKKHINIYYGHGGSKAADYNVF